MNYSSTRGKDKDLNFVDVMLNGLAKDGGLYVPDKIPKFNLKDLEKIRNLRYCDLAYNLTMPFIVNKEISEEEYKCICEKTYSSSFGKELISINKLNEKEYILNLFHGPTYAFKDYALQLLGNLYDFILKKKKKQLTIVGATSGDTGSAAIYGCSKSKNVNMFILFPKGKVSEIQRKQMTTYNKRNVTNIAVKGNFDDCQKLVKDLFKLNVKKDKYNLAAINSINWVRILGQIVYYFWSYFQVEHEMKPVNFVVPTGNFGNAYAGFISKLMGLPINKIVISSNRNDILTRFFSSGLMEKADVFKSLSPSMDIQVSSNFERLLFHFLKDPNKISKFFNDLDKNGVFSINKKKLKEILENFKAGKLNDNQTKKSIKLMFDENEVVIDPHTAVGFSVGRKVLNKNEKRVYLATAHHGKFIETVKDSINKDIEYPKKLFQIIDRKETYETINNNLHELESLIDSKS